MQNVAGSLPLLQSARSKLYFEMVFGDGWVGSAHRNQTVVVVLWIQLANQPTEFVDIRLKDLIVFVVVNALLLLIFLLLAVGARRRIFFLFTLRFLL